jgi:hypothetical protein
MQHIVKETNKSTQQQTAKCVTPFTFHSRIRKWQDVTVDEMNVVLTLFMLMELLTDVYTRLILLQELPTLIPSFSSKTLPLERLELTVQFLHFIHNSTVNVYQGPANFSKLIQLFNT